MDTTLKDLLDAWRDALMDPENPHAYLARAAIEEYGARLEREILELRKIVSGK